MTTTTTTEATSVQSLFDEAHEHYKRQLNRACLSCRLDIHFGQLTVLRARAGWLRSRCWVCGKRTNT